MNDMPQRFTLALAVSLLAGMAGVAASQAADPMRDEPLWVPSDARVSRPAETDRDGTTAIAFDLFGVSDLDRLASGLREHYAGRGWRERKQGLFTPALATSFASGWRRGGGGVRGPSVPHRVREWHGEWASGETVVVYHLLAVQRTPGVSFEVHVSAARYPPAVARSIRRRAAAGGCQP